MDQKLDAFLAARHALKELNLPDFDERLKDLAEKCGVDAALVEVWRPFGGATSFDALDTYRRGEEMRHEYNELNYQLRMLMTNILDDQEMSDGARATAITNLAAEFARRAETIPAEVNQDMREDAGPRFTDRRASSLPDIKPASSSFRAFKEGEQWRWFTVYTNTARDKTGERFPAQAHKDFVAWVDRDEAHRMPELWDWHTPVGLAEYRDGRKGMGRADFLDYQEGLAIAAGYFYPEFSYAAERFAQEKDLGVSHGYQYQKWALDQDTGDYAHYYTFEISPLPRFKAANELTLFLPDMAKEDLMELRADRRERLVKTHGEAKVKMIEEALGGAAATLAGKEISFKDLEDALDATPPAAAPAGDTVPSTAANAAGGAPQADVEKAKDLIISAVKEAIAPMETRFAAIEGRLTTMEGDFKDRLDKAVADSFGPRFQPDPSKSPSADPDNVVNGNTPGLASAVREAANGMKQDPEQAGIPEHLQWYLQNLPSAGAAAEAVAAATGAPA